MTHRQIVAADHHRRTIHWRGAEHYVQVGCTCGWMGPKMPETSTNVRAAREQHTAHVNAVSVAS